VLTSVHRRTSLTFQSVAISVADLRVTPSTSVGFRAL
jgi:hypothetical protein